MFNFLASFIFLIATQYSISFAADVAVADPLRARIEGITARMAGFLAMEYNADADAQARAITTQALACVERELTPAEKRDLDTAFLKAELFQHFNTNFGSTRTHDHRIVYDFLSLLNKDRIVSPQEKNNLTRLTVLSLAAQEFFWNPNSLVPDLKRRVKSELRFGLFRQGDNPLNVSASIHLSGSDELSAIIEAEITDELRDTLEDLSTKFKEGTIGNLYTALLANVAAHQEDSKKYAPLALSAIPDAADFGIIDGVRAAFYPSSAAGVQCGFNSLFIQTENAVVGAGAGTARAKMIQALEDDITDPTLRRLYIFESPYSDPSFMRPDGMFEALLARQRAIAAGDTAGKAQAAENVRLLELVKDQYIATQREVGARREAAIKQGTQAMVKAILALKESILDTFDEAMGLAGTEAAKWAQPSSPKYKVYHAFIGCMTDLGLIGDEPKDPEEFFTAKALEKHAVFEFFQHICALVDKKDLSEQILDIITAYRAIPALLDEEAGPLERDFLTHTVVPLVERIDPTIVDNRAIVEHVKQKAEAEGIRYLLECASPYVQFWAKKNNLNICVFSAAEAHGQPPIDIKVREDDSAYSNTFAYYPSRFVGERRLATVILTSPTAKTLFLTKSPGHYDKLITENDFSAIAKQVRQTNLMTSLSIPLLARSGKVFNASALLASLTSQVKKPRTRTAFDAAAAIAAILSQAETDKSGSNVDGK